MAKKDTPKKNPHIRLVNFDENGWEFEYTRLTQREHDRLYDLIDMGYSDKKATIPKAEQGYRRLIKEYPEFIDAYHHLAVLLHSTDRASEAADFWTEAVNMGINCTPASFLPSQDLIEWAFLDNRPFLRAYHSLGMVFLHDGAAEDALDIFTNILSLNPGDNQGIRSLAVICNFLLNRPWAVLEITQRYEDDMMPDVVYGQVLALMQMGLKSDAHAALSEAAKHLPLIAQELVKKHHSQPEMHSGYIIVGGPDEAYSYWMENAEFWHDTPGAIDFLREYLAQNEPGLPEESGSPVLEKSPLAKPDDGEKLTQKDAYSVPKKMQPTHETIVGLTDSFCDTHLTSEYTDLCRKLTAKLCRKRPSPLTKGRPATWAAAIVYTIARVNFLFDKTQTPHMTAKELCKLIGTSQNTASTKSTQIMDLLDITQFEIEWTLPSQMDDNPMAWFILIDGLMVDIRNQPREIQEEALRMGMIPYLPKQGFN